MNPIMFPMNLILNLIRGINEFLFGYPYYFITIWSVLWCFYAGNGGIGGLLRRYFNDVVIEFKLWKYRRRLKK